MSAAAPSPNAPSLAVPPALLSGPPPPPVTDPPSSPPNVSAPPPVIPIAPPPVTQSPPPAVIAAPPPAVPPSATQLPPPVVAPLPRYPASPPLASSSPPPPQPASTSPNPPTPPSVPQESSPPPPFISPPPPPTSPPPSPPSPASKPPISAPPPHPASTPPKRSPSPPSSNPPPPPNSKEPQTSPPPPRKGPPTTYSPPPESPSVNQRPTPPAPITPSKSPPPPSSTPPSQPSWSPTNASTNSSPPTIIQLAPPPPYDISPTSINSNPYAPEKSNSNGNIGANVAVAAGIGVSLGVIAIGLVIMIIWCAFKRRKEASLNGHYIVPSPYGSSPKADSSLKVNSSSPLLGSVLASDFAYLSKESGGLRHTRSWFTYEELVVATNGFSPNNLLGEGGFGYVYKGYLPDKRVIAVKQLNIGGGQGEREFKAEVELISRIHHRHLVSLVGYCVADSRRLLVYEYVPNNTLYFHLHGEGRPPMIWASRVKVATGAARGLAYLHEDCHPRIIHRDIKSSNILLDNNFDAKVSDFGLAKLAFDSYTHVTTRVMGTFGYMAPEYASSGKLTEKSDVYSFGVVLLELITGRKPVDESQPSGDESLVEWARPLLGHAIETAELGSLVDPRLEKNYVDAEMFRMIEAAAACVRQSASKRPRMGQVVRFFESLLAADITNGMQMGQSQVYDSAEHSAEIRLFRKMAFGSHNYNSDVFSDESQFHDNTRQLENESTVSERHHETTHILEVDLESDNRTTVLVSHHPS